MPKWIDLHTHLNFLETSPEESLALAEENGVERLITIGTCPDDLPVVLNLAKEFGPKVYCTLGIHPHDAKLYNEEVKDFMEKHLGDDEVVAVGEIGLDYYYDNSPRDTQRQVFREQLEIAKKWNLPVQIHTRDAEEDTIEILREFGGEIKGVIHCFTGTQMLADAALDLGLDISISGVVTFNNASKLREIVKSVPLDRMHVETDSPFLTPVPLRGRKNTSAYVIHVGKFVAELKNVSEQEFSEQMKKNALNVFSKINWP